MCHIMVLKTCFPYLSLCISRIVYLIFLHYTMVFRTAYIFQNYLYSQKKCRQLIWEVAYKRTAKSETKGFAWYLLLLYKFWRGLYKLLLFWDECFWKNITSNETEFYHQLTSVTLSKQNNSSLKQLINDFMDRPS